MSFITCDQDPFKEGDHIMLVQLVCWVKALNENKTVLVKRTKAGRGFSRSECGVIQDVVTSSDLWVVLKVSKIHTNWSGVAQASGVFNAITPEGADETCVVPPASFVRVHPDNINNQEYLDAVKAVFNNRYYEEFPDEAPE